MSERPSADFVPWLLAGGGLALVALVGSAGAANRRQARAAPKVNALRPRLGPLGQQLKALRPAFAKAAQEVVDGWEQDAEGFCEEYGAGGVRVMTWRSALTSVAGRLPDVEV